MLVIVFTVIYVNTRMMVLPGRVKAIGLSAAREWTIYSPLYWILVTALIIAMYLLFRRWVSTPVR